MGGVRWWIWGGEAGDLFSVDAVMTLAATLLAPIAFVALLGLGAAVLVPIAERAEEGR